MIWRCDRHQRALARHNPIEPGSEIVERTAHPDHCLAVQHLGHDGAECLDVQAKGHRRELRIEGTEPGPELVGWQHHIDDEADLGLKPFVQALHAGTQAIHAASDRTGLREHRLSILGQHRAPRTRALEQGEAQLRLKIGNAIAHDRDGAPEPPRSGREACPRRPRREAE